MRGLHRGPHGRLLLAANWDVHIENPHYYRKSGNIKGWESWDEVIGNLVVNAGIDDALDVHLSGGTQDTTWFVFLMGTTPTVAAGDTMASHAGWTEQTGYDEAARQAWTDAGVSSQSVTNSASPATFTITSNSTVVGGAGLCGDNTKSGTTGIFYAGGAFSGGDVTLNAAATIDITATFSGADDAA